jgi:hypothetical protein
MIEKNFTEETIVPNVLIDPLILKTSLSMGAKFTYFVLASCCKKHDHSWPSNKY